MFIRNDLIFCLLAVLCVCGCKNVTKKMEFSQHAENDTTIVIENQKEDNQKQRCNICSYIKEVGPYSVICCIAANELVVQTLILSEIE